MLLIMSTLNRRQLLKIATTVAPWAVLPGTAAAGATASAQESRPEVAFTFDDPKTQPAVPLRGQEVNERICAALARHRIRSVLFVCGMRVASQEGRDLVSAWDRAGHLVANHSYSHLNLNAVTLEQFQADLLKNEPLIAASPHLTRLFRYPFFKEGDTAEKRDGMRSYLKERGYRIGRATIDASDWAISLRLESRLKGRSTAAMATATDLDGYRSFFLQHIWDRTQYYHSLGQQILARPVRHTVLLHHNVLNALFLDDLIAMFVSKGWRPVDAEYAYADPIYDRQPKCLPAGESLLWGLAKETGRFEAQLRYPGEDDVYENPRMDELKL
jgi:peptidoglycan-N-acetylglucosamine deacetylase